MYVTYFKQWWYVTCTSSFSMHAFQRQNKWFRFTVISWGTSGKLLQYSLKYFGDHFLIYISLFLRHFRWCCISCNGSHWKLFMVVWWIIIVQRTCRYTSKVLATGTFHLTHCWSLPKIHLFIVWCWWNKQNFIKDF